MIQSFDPIIFPDTKILVLGSIPGELSLQQHEYYGNKNNAFWKILFSLFETNFSHDYSDKINLLEKSKIGLWDTIFSCQRKGSSDAAIQNVVVNQIADLCLKYPNINYIAFNGKTSENYFRKYIGTVQNVKFLSLPSTSPANAQMNFETKLNKWKILVEKLNL